jgi:pSer/pThr/pTyr-binding forkhead associated (FHA) protein
LIFTVGRSPDDDYRVDDQFASTRNAIIRARGFGFFTIEDGESTNGTWLNGQRVWEPVELRYDDVVRVGRTVVTANRLLRLFAEKIQK